MAFYGNFFLPENRMQHVSRLLLLLLCSARRASALLPGGAALPQLRVANSFPHRSRAVTAGPRVKIVSVGKTKEAWVATAIDAYVSRLRGSLEIEQLAVRDDAALAAAIERTAEPCILLDERGGGCTSVQFGERMYAALEAGGSRLSFFIGGAEGLPPELKRDRSRLLSLSTLTFPHQIAKLLLVEQVYRAAEIRKGSGYHKD